VELGSDEQFNEVWRDSLKENVEKIGNSASFLGMLSGKFDDPLQCMQFGIAVMLDKPIYLLVAKGVKVPRNLSRMAQKIEYVKWGDTDAMRAAVDRLLKEKNQ
jgi:hypothetical protein